MSPPLVLLPWTWTYKFYLEIVAHTHFSMQAVVDNQLLLSTCKLLLDLFVLVHLSAELKLSAAFVLYEIIVFRKMNLRLRTFSFLHKSSTLAHVANRNIPWRGSFFRKLLEKHEIHWSVGLIWCSFFVMTQARLEFSGARDRKFFWGGIASLTDLKFFWRGIVSLSDLQVEASACIFHWTLRSCSYVKMSVIFISGRSPNSQSLQ